MKKRMAAFWKEEWRTVVKDSREVGVWIWDAGGAGGAWD